MTPEHEELRYRAAAATGALRAIVETLRAEDRPQQADHAERVMQDLSKALTADLLTAFGKKKI